MQDYTKGLLKSMRFSGILLSGLIITACSSSEDQASAEDLAGPAAVNAGVYDSTVVEDADTLEFIVSLASASTATVSIDYATVDGSAVAGSDYAATSGTLQFVPGEVRKSVTVTVLSNPATSAGTSKNMQLVLNNPRNTALTVDLSLIHI